MKEQKEILKQHFLNIQDIQTLFKMSRDKAKKVYQLANSLDDKKLKEFRVEERKVTIDSVCKVLGTTTLKVRKSLARS